MLFDTFIILSSSVLFAVFSIIFRYELKSLKKNHPPADFNVLAPKIMKLLIKVYRNTPSALIALSKLDPSCQLIGPPSKPLARSFFISDVECLEPNLIQVPTASRSASYLEDEAKIIHLLQSSIREVQRVSFEAKIRSITTLVLTGIIMAPIPITLLATFYGGSMLNLLPLIVSLFYGISLQLILIVFKRYMKLLI